MEPNDEEKNLSLDGGDHASPTNIGSEVVISLTNLQPRMFGFLLKRLASRDQALEVLQNVNLTICRKADQFEAGTDFAAWAFTIARFQLLAYRQANARERVLFSTELIDAIDLLDGSQSFEQPTSDRKAALSECLQHLPKQQQQLIIRRYAESFSVKGIAADLGKSANAVSMLLHRIREQLLACIQRRLAENSHE